MNDDTRVFLALFDGRHTFQTFDDKKERSDLARIHHDAADLERLNQLGAGVYLMINEGDGEGRSNQNVTHVRAVFADFDGQPLPNTWPLEPSAIVESSPGKYHAYWLTINFPLDRNLFNHCQHHLALAVGSKPDDAKGLARVMRVPGFMHNKSEPYQTRLIEAHPERKYTLDEIIHAFNIPPLPKPATSDPNYKAPPAEPDEVPTPEKILEVTLRDADLNRGRNNIGFDLACQIRDNGYPKQVAERILTEYAHLVHDGEHPYTVDEALGSARSAYTQPAREPWTPLSRGGTITLTTSTTNHEGELEEITSAAVKAPITIQAGGYASVRETKNGPVYTQLTNWTFTPTLALSWPDGSTGHRGDLIINSTARHAIDLPAKAWSSRRDLLALISAYDAVVFANSNSDIAHIRQFILTNHPDLPTAHGVTTYGLHKVNDDWQQLYEDTHHPNIFYVGTPVDPGPAYKAIKPGTNDEIDAARQTIKMLPHLVTPGAALALLGYGMASAFAPRITPGLGDRLPFLYITGERESGKSSSIELVLTLTTGNPSARLRKAPGLTPYQYDSSFANMNNRLAALDEYRPGALDDAQLRKHHDLGTKWRGSGIAAKDHAYILNSPLIVAGEGFTEDAAALSRGPLYFIAKTDRGDTDVYLRAQSAPNHAYAHHLANTAATLPETEHKARLERARNLAKAASEARGGPRLQFALTFIAYGLLHLQTDVGQPFTDAAIQRCLEIGVTQTLDGGDESKTNVEIFLEQLGSAIVEAKDPWAYMTPGAVTGTVIIRVSPSVELVKRRYGKDAAIGNTRLLRQYAQKTTWIDTSAVHKDLLNLPVRGVKVDLSAAPERCDLSAIEYLAERMRRNA